jgi:hypothetical protein
MGPHMCDHTCLTYNHILQLVLQQQVQQQRGYCVTLAVLLWVLCCESRAADSRSSSGLHECTSHEGCSQHCARPAVPGMLRQLNMLRIAHLCAKPTHLLTRHTSCGACRLDATVNGSADKQE